MALIEKVRRDGVRVHVFDFRDQKDRRIRERHVGLDKRKAEKLYRERMGEVAAGTYRHPVLDVEPPPPDVLTFGRLVEKFLNAYHTRRDAGLDYYKWRAAAWLTFFDKDRPAAEIGVSDVDAFRTAREAVVAASTVRKDMASLGTLFRWAVARELVPRNPADSMLVRRPREPRERHLGISLDDQHAVCDAAPRWLRRVILFMAFTGADRCDVAGLSWSQVDETAQRIDMARSKTAVPFEVHYGRSQAVKAILADARKARDTAKLIGEDTEGRVFLGPRHRARGKRGVAPVDGCPLTPNQINLALRRVYATAGVKPDGGPCRTYRHAFQSRMLESGVPRDARRYLMGHSEQAMTDRYGGPSSEYLADALARLDRYWTPADLTGEVARVARLAK